MAKNLTVEIVRMDGFTVRWGPRGDFDPPVYLGIVAVSSLKQAKALKMLIEKGVTPATAIATAIVPPRRKPGRPMQIQKMGGLARSKQLTAEQLSAIGKLAAAARWGKRKAGSHD